MKTMCREDTLFLYISSLSKTVYYVMFSKNNTERG